MKNTKNIIKYLILGGLFITPFIAFIVPGAMFFPFISGKGFAFRIIVELMFGLFIILAFIDNEYRPKLSWITKSILAFTGIMLVADLLGANPYKSLWSNYERMEGFVLMIHLAMYYIVLSSFLKTTSLWNKFWNTSIAASLIMSLYGVLQLMGKLNINQGGVRVDATFGNSSYLAIYMVFSIFLCLYMLVAFAKEKWQKWTYIIIAILETVVLYYTATRGAILGLIGGLLLAGLIVVLKEKENKTLRKFAYWLAGVIAVVIVGFVLFRNTPLVQNSPVLSRFSTLSFAEFQTQGRYYVWPMAIKGVVDRPILGWGQENFNFVFNKYYDPKMFGQEEWFDRTHNIVLDWLIAGGILGFLAYVSMYVALLYYVWRKKSHLNLSEKGLFTGMIVAYIFHNMFVFDNLISYMIFFSVLAFIHSFSTNKEVEGGKFYTKDFSKDAINYVVIPLTIIITGLTVYYVNIPALFANQTLIQAISPQPDGGAEKNLALFKQVYDYNSFGSGEATEQLTQITSQLQQSQASDTIKKEFFDFTKQKIESKVMESPNDARYLVFAGSFLNRFSQYDEAISYLTRALEESPNKISIYFELGTSYLGKGDKQKMFEEFQKAYDLNPNTPETQSIYTVGAIYTKNADVLKQMSSKIDPNTIISDNRFLQAYAGIGDYTSVINILNARLAKDPTNMQYKLSLASAYATVGQKDKAISLIREMETQDPSFKTQGEGYVQQILSGK